MAVRVITTTSILSGRPGDAVVLDDEVGRWLIVSGDEEQSARRSRGAQPLISDLQRHNPRAALADVLEAYIGNHSYSRASAWTESEQDFEATVRLLIDRLR